MASTPMRSAGQPGARTPDMQVATRIVAQLEVRALIAPEQSSALRAQLAAGALTQEAWIMTARRAIAAAEADGTGWDEGAGWGADGNADQGWDADEAGDHD